jgi:four helix bundle protein
MVVIKSLNIFMKKEELKLRTQDFALRIFELVNALPNSIAGRDVGHQLFKSGTSVAANYRSACRGRSTAEFKSKLHIVLEEIDEFEFWLEFIIQTKLLPKNKVESLWKEAGELTSIFAKSYYTISNKITKS